MPPIEFKMFAEVTYSMGGGSELNVYSCVIPDTEEFGKCSSGFCPMPGAGCVGTLHSKQAHNGALHYKHGAACAKHRCQSQSSYNTTEMQFTDFLLIHR